jgi:hypothetical protein
VEEHKEKEADRLEGALEAQDRRVEAGLDGGNRLVEGREEGHSLDQSSNLRMTTLGTTVLRKTALGKTVLRKTALRRMALRTTALAHTAGIDREEAQEEVHSISPLLAPRRNDGGGDGVDGGAASCAKGPVPRRRRLSRNKGGRFCVDVFHFACTAARPAPGGPGSRLPTPRFPRLSRNHASS